MPLHTRPNYFIGHFYEINVCHDVYSITGLIVYETQHWNNNEFTAYYHRQQRVAFAYTASVLLYLLCVSVSVSVSESDLCMVWPIEFCMCALRWCIQYVQHINGWLETKLNWVCLCAVLSECVQQTFFGFLCWNSCNPAQNQNVISKFVHCTDESGYEQTVYTATAMTHTCKANENGRECESERANKRERERGRPSHWQLARPMINH